MSKRKLRLYVEFTSGKTSYTVNWADKPLGFSVLSFSEKRNHCRFSKNYAAEWSAGNLQRSVLRYLASFFIDSALHSAC